MSGDMPGSTTQWLSHGSFLSIKSEHPDTLTSMNDLAVTYLRRGRWTEAETLFVQVMQTRKTVLGPEHPDTLESMSNLALTYRDQGRWTEAEKRKIYDL